MCENRLPWRELAGAGVSLWLVCWLIAPGIAFGQTARGESGGRLTQGDELFTSTNVPRIQIEIPAKSVERLRGRGFSWGWGGPTRERPEVQVTVREGELVYTNVALHLKGSAGSFQPIESKPGLTLNFDKYVKGQSFHGLQKISLNNSVQDPSYLCEKICRELFNAAGVPAPRADYAVVQLNGRDLGLYVLLEGYNRQFLKRHFKNTKGNLSEGGFLKDVDSTLATNSGENPANQSERKALVTAANLSDRALRWTELQKVLDVDRFVTFMAMEVLVCHWDGYCMNKNNYRVYHDMDSDRIVFMPHGMDQMFGVMMVQPSLGVRPPLQGLVAKAVMETPEGRRRYFEQLGQLNRSLLDIDTLTNRIWQTASRIQSVLGESSSASATRHQREVEDLCGRIIQRKQSLEEQLSSARGGIVEFDSAGVARLSAWTSLTNSGHPKMTYLTNSAEQALLQIVAQGSTVASWRSKVLLEGGHYRLEARLQTKAVSVDPRDRRAGAGLRINGKSASARLQGNSDWRDTAFEFDVPDGIQDVELVCELRASEGEVWFDASSIRLLQK